MVSTYLSYNLVNRDLKANLERVRASTAVSREEQYYKDNISKIKTVDEFVDNYRIYSYAMKAHGLEDMTYAKAFMKKVLESDLTDTESFANRLSDSRYREFATAFQFSSDTAIVQTKDQIEDVISHYQQQITDEAEAVDAENGFFEATIGSVTSVDDLLGNERLRNYALNALGLDTKYWDKTHLTKVLTSDLADPASYVNSLTVNNKGDYLALAAAFNFNALGTLDAGDTAQTTAQTAGLVSSYTFTVPTRAVPAAAELNKEYFEGKIGTITNVDDLVNDARMLSYVKVAYGLEDIPLKSTIKNILTSDLADPLNYAKTFGGAEYEALARGFSFLPDGTIAAGGSAQTANQTTATSGLYMSRYDDKQTETDEALYTFYRTTIGTVDSIDELKGTGRLYDFVLTAFGFDPDTTKDNQVRKILTSDLGDPASFASAQKDPRYREMAASFNFDSNGDKTAPLLAQSQSQIQQVAKDYVINKTRFGNEDQKDKATAEASYYSEKIQGISTVAEFLGNKRLVDFVLEANGIEPKTVSNDTLKQLFASDLDDPESFANQQEDHRLVEIVSSFNFDQKGNIASRDTGIQGRYGEMTTQYLYLQQSLEEEVGVDSAGARLALYFKRMAPDFKSAFDILGDTALLEVFRTTFELPKEMSSMDIDKQKLLVERHLDLQELQDPDKLEKFIARFTAMYDLTNDTQSTSVVNLFNNSKSSISADTLFSLAQLKR